MLERDIRGGLRRGNFQIDYRGGGFVRRFLRAINLIHHLSEFLRSLVLGRVPDAIIVEGMCLGQRAKLVGIKRDNFHPFNGNE